MALFPSVSVAGGVTGAAVAVLVSLPLYPVRYFPPPVTTGLYPATRARRAFTYAAPALYALAGGLLVLSRLACWPCGRVFRGYRAVPITGGVTIALGAYHHTPVTNAATRWRGITSPPCLPCQYIK